MTAIKFLLTETIVWRDNMVYVLFVYVVTSVYKGGGPALTNYEFKDKVQCENAIKVMEKRIKSKLPYNDTEYFEAFCLEVRK